MELTQDEFRNIDSVITEIAKKKLKKTEDRKTYDKEYNKKYYEQKKKDVVLIICEKCYGHFNYYSKSQHEKSKRHKLSLELNKTI